MGQGEEGEGKQMASAQPTVPWPSVRRPIGGWLAGDVLHMNNPFECPKFHQIARAIDATQQIQQIARRGHAKPSNLLREQQQLPFVCRHFTSKRSAERLTICVRFLPTVAAP
ncbi:hypothetical protein GPALN_005643 [Globodera pallida]|nr:hypothetical protein GPALN_005643 [Globodera pallida]